MARRSHKCQFGTKWTTAICGQQYGAFQSRCPEHVYTKLEDTGRYGSLCAAKRSSTLPMCPSRCCVDDERISKQIPIDDVVWCKDVTPIVCKTLTALCGPRSYVADPPRLISKLTVPVTRFPAGVERPLLQRLQRQTGYLAQ